MRFKNVPFKVKAGPDSGLPAGVFDGYASVFGNVDSYGDVVDPGAFTRTLSDWQAKGAASGAVIPVLWGHDSMDPFANIGGLTSAEEDEKGLHVTGQLDMDNPTAKQVYRLMKGGRTTSMSFAYSVVDSAVDDDVNHLKDLDLFEVSVVQNPANPLAAVESVKSAAASIVDGVKSGRVLAQKHIDALHTAYDALGGVIAAAEAESDDGGSGAGGNASGSGGGKSSGVPDELSGVKGAPNVEAVGGGPSANTLTVLQAVLMLED